VPAFPREPSRKTAAIHSHLKEPKTTQVKHESGGAVPALTAPQALPLPLQFDLPFYWDADTAGVAESG